jgi:hypothetical protein
MATTLLGLTTVTYAGQTTLSGYLVLREETGAEVKDELIEGAAGADVAALVYQVKPSVKLRLVVLGGAPATDFPTGLMATATGYTAFRVRSAPIPKEKGARIIEVELVNDFA